jgi:hypothetical protein
VKVFNFLLSYVAGFFIILLIASAVDTAGLMLVAIFSGLRCILALLVLAVSALGTYLGVVAYCWLASVTSLHVSSAILAVVVIVEYSSDSVQYRTARNLALRTGDNMSGVRLDAAIAQANRIGHVFGFAVAGLAHLRGSPAF